MFYSETLQRLFAHGSGIAIMTASGSSMPLIAKNSSVLSSIAESDPLAFIDRKHLVQYLLPYHSEAMRFFPGRHLVRIAPDRINFSVVHHEAVSDAHAPSSDSYSC